MPPRRYTSRSYKSYKRPTYSRSYRRPYTRRSYTKSSTRRTYTPRKTYTPRAPAPVVYADKFDRNIHRADEVIGLAGKIVSPIAKGVASTAKWLVDDEIKGTIKNIAQGKIMQTLGRIITL